MRERALATASLSRDYRLNSGFGSIGGRFRRLRLLDVKRARPHSLHGIAGMAAILLLWSQPVLGQADPPAAAGTSRGENFSAKPAPQLFATDCTGGGCHKGPQGLGKNYGQFGLTTFLREHYTNSRQSAAALAEYLLRTQGAAETRNPRSAPGAQSSRAAVRPDEVAPGSPSPPAPRRAAEPSDAKPTAGGRTQRGRHTTAATPTAAPTAATPTAATPTPEPSSPPSPPAPPVPPAPKQYDIFD